MENIINRLTVQAYEDIYWSFFEHIEYKIDWAKVCDLIIDLHDNSVDLFRLCVHDQFAIQFGKHLSLAQLGANGLLSDSIKSELVTPRSNNNFTVKINRE